MLQKRKGNRLKSYDYSLPGYYFVTICVKNMEYVFGNIKNNKMKLNKYGKIVEFYLNKLSGKYDNVELDYFVVMPNHVHAIIIISSVGTIHELSLHNEFPQDKSSAKQTNLSKIIGYLKMNSSRDIHKSGLTNFKWQRSFYDRIIRNENELFNVRKYILQNPLKWDITKNLIENIEL